MGSAELSSLIGPFSQRSVKWATNRKLCVLWTSYRKVPLKDVVLQRADTYLQMVLTVGRQLSPRGPPVTVYYQLFKYNLRSFEKL